MGVLIIHNSHVIENGKTEMHRCISWTFDIKWTASVVSQGDELSKMNNQGMNEQELWTLTQEIYALTMLKINRNWRQSSCELFSIILCKKSNKVWWLTHHVLGFKVLKVTIY